MSIRVKHSSIVILGMLVLLIHTGCAGPSETIPYETVSQQEGATVSTPTGIEVIRQPNAEAVPTNSDGFAPGELEVITPENADRLQELAVIGPGRFADDIVISPDDEYVAVAASNGVLFYDPVSGELLDIFPTSSEVIAMAGSPDGQKLATVTLIKSDEHFPAKAPNPDSYVTHPMLTIWDLTTGEAVLVQLLAGRGCGEYAVNDLTFSPDGALLAFRDEYFMLNFTETDNLCVVSAKDGSLLQAIPLETSWAPTGGLAFANEGQTLVTIFNQDQGGDQYLREMHKYDLESGERVQTFEIERGSDLIDFTNLALSPDGQWLAVPASGGVRIYALADGRLMSTIGRESALGVDVAFSPDGQTLAFSLRDSTNSLAKVVGLASVPDGALLWEVPVANLLYVPTLSEDLANTAELAFSSDGTQIFNLAEPSFVNQNGFIQILDAQEGRETGRIYVPSVYVRQELSPDGSQVLFGGYQDGEVQLWSVPGNQMLWSADEHTAMVVGAAFSPDGQQAATASLDGTVRLWRVADGSLERTLSEDLSPSWLVAYAPDGGQLASLSEDGMLRLWNPSTGELAKEIPTGVLGPWQRDLVCTPGGERVFISSGCQDFQCQEDPNEGLHWVDLETGEVELFLNSSVYHFTLTADQSLAGMQAHGIQIFDMGSLQIIRGHTSPLGIKGELAGAGISPDGSLILSGNGYGLHVWDTASGQLIGIIEGTQPWGEITFSADQRLVSISGNFSGVFSVWGVPAE
jgi:WD40 repeat protein